MTDDQNPTPPAETPAQGQPPTDPPASDPPPAADAPPDYSGLPPVQEPGSQNPPPAQPEEDDAPKETGEDIFAKFESAVAKVGEGIGVMTRHSAADIAGSTVFDALKLLNAGYQELKDFIEKYGPRR